ISAGREIYRPASSRSRCVNRFVDRESVQSPAIAFRAERADVVDGFNPLPLGEGRVRVYSALKLRSLIPISSPKGRREQDNNKKAHSNRILNSHRLSAKRLCICNQAPSESERLCASGR